MHDERPDTVKHHPHAAADRFDGGDMDCGNGLLLQIRRRIDPLRAGQLLEILSSEPSVADDLPAWCRMTGNELVSTWHDRDARRWSFLVSRGRFAPTVDQTTGAERPEVAPTIIEARPRPDAATGPQAGGGGSIVVAPLSACGIGSWPRPDWLLHALRERLEGRLDEPRFQELADRSVAEVVK